METGIFWGSVCLSVSNLVQTQKGHLRGGCYRSSDLKMWSQAFEFGFWIVLIELRACLIRANGLATYESQPHRHLKPSGVYRASVKILHRLSSSSKLL